MISLTLDHASKRVLLVYTNKSNHVLRWHPARRTKRGMELLSTHCRERRVSRCAQAPRAGGACREGHWGQEMGLASLFLTPKQHLGTGKLHQAIRDGASDQDAGMCPEGSLALLTQTAGVWGGSTVPQGHRAPPEPRGRVLSP